MENTEELLEKVKQGFTALNLENIYKEKALEFINTWLTDEEFRDYRPQLMHLIESKDWDYLLDCFYQIIPFGTGGRRGEVGIGPNRINSWTIQASAQGHSQYLISKYGQDAIKKGVVLSYGVREFFTNSHFNDQIPNPVKNLKGVDLAYSAAQVYAANGIKTYIFDAPRTTPELSFAIRYLGAVAGDMFDASHNPPEHNGKKVYDSTGGQLIPPYDEDLVKEVTEKVDKIKKVDVIRNESAGLVEMVGSEIDKAYVEAIKKLSLSGKRGAKIIYTPLHGVGSTSVKLALEELGFNVTPDPKTSNQSGKFENVTFNIPNPEVIESFDTTLKFAENSDADIILNSDPDADRIGIMVRHNSEWRFLNGNEIAAILTRYVTEKKKGQVRRGVVIKTSVTTNLVKEICDRSGSELIGELPVGFKYIGEEMNRLEKEGRIDDFLIGIEESHGYIAGNYVRDKDASVGAIWMAELASELKESSRTLVDYLDETYSIYGYYRNYLTEIRLPGAEGMSQIQRIQTSLRTERPSAIGKYKVERIEDFQDRLPIVSETDKASKDVLAFHLEPFDNHKSVKITVRPSGTEPKAKMYFEIGNNPAEKAEIPGIKERSEELLKDLEKTFMLHCFRIIGVEFPERGFLLFWQLPMKIKMKYFEIEPNIEELKNVEDRSKRANELNKLLEFLGSDPIEKVDKAFKAKNGRGIREFLNL